MGKPLGLQAMPTHPHVNIRTVCLAAALSFPFFSGCAQGPKPANSRSQDGKTLVLDMPDDGSGQAVSTVIDARPVALANGRQVPWGDLKPLLTELAGAQALEELLLDRALDDLAAERGVIITRDDLSRERTTLLESMHEDRATALQLLEDMRTARGLGPVRFERLLRRTAIMRAIVAPDIEITEQSIARMHDLLHGPKRQPRLIVTQGLNDAQRALERIRGGEQFVDVATEVSIDPSASRGGLLAPIARQDPAYPPQLRETLWSIGIGAISDPILLDNRYAIVQYQREFPADGMSLEETRQDVERMVRLDQERVLMDQLARQLLASQTVNVVDRSLRELWQRRKAATRP